jgi:CubicO group peptidase (beta-lactamase class C family)
MKVNADAAGLDASRLERITDHFQTRYIEAGRIAGCQVAVARHGNLGYFRNFGSMDLERGKPVAEDTIWRIYSMTKPITGVALMSLYERGHFQLSDPLHRFIPEWKDLKVGEGETLVEPQRPMSVKDVLMHMSGLGYGAAAGQRPAAMRETDMTLETLCSRLAEQPLHFHPGTKWLYSFSTDVCGRLVEVISGKRFDDYLSDELFGPLGMDDTAFMVPDSKADRFAANYGRDANKKLTLIDDPERSIYRTPRTFLSGGGGLVSTMPDYLRFCQMLLSGGELDGVRILGRKTVELMSTNHLPGGAQLRDFASGPFGETGFDGVGFGLTMAVSLGPAESQVIGSRGDYYWGGAASTIFWIDPAEDMLVVFMTQFMPSATFNFRNQLKTLVYPAIVD